MSRLVLRPIAWSRKSTRLRVSVLIFGTHFLFSYMDGLEERLRAIEASIAKHDQLFSHAQRRSRGDSTPLHGEQWLLADNGRQSPLGELDPGSGISLRGADLQDLPPEDKVTDGMAASFSEEEDSGFFGGLASAGNEDFADDHRAIVKHISYAIYLSDNASRWSDWCT